MKHDADFWTLAENIGRFACGALTAEIDLTRPHLGLRAVQLREQAVPGDRLALVPSEGSSIWPATLADAYVRGRDLVATYAGVETWPYAPTVYWSAEAAGAGSEFLAGLSLMISVQTNLLDTHPRIDVRTTFAANDVVLVSVAGDELLVDSHVDGPQSLDPQTTACGLIWRLPGDELSYAEIMPSSDFRTLAVARDASGNTQSRWELFGEFLEKGVIRRARLQTIYLPRENDVQLTAECCQAIKRKPLPLTT